MVAFLHLLLALARAPIPDPSLHKVDVRIAGPLAMVEVWRAVEATTRDVGGRQVGSYFDLNLPEGAAVLDWELVEKPRATPLLPRTEIEANAGLAALLKMRQLSLPATAVDEGTDFRVHVTPIADGERAVLHYRYSALAGCRDGRLVLRIPDSLEESPVPADVTVTIEPSADGNALAEASLAGKPVELRAPARKTTMRGLAPARTGWEIAWKYVAPSGTLPGVALAAGARVVGLDSSGARPRKVPQYALAALVCTAGTAAPPPSPNQVLLLVDRSRSVGQGGLSVERVLGRELVEALPPSVAFNAILFGSTAEPLFALPRMPTREALDAFFAAADPNRLENGTDLIAALSRGRALLGGAGEPGRSWVVLVTDGALPASQTFARLQTALAAGGAARPKVLVLLVRQHGDEEVPAGSVLEYARFAREFGGLVRVVAPGNPGETARGIVAAMGRGGDLLDVQLEGQRLAPALAPGSGATVALTTGARLPRRASVRIGGHGLDGERQAELVPVPVKREWLDPLLESARTRRRAWSGATGGLAVAVLPGPVADSRPADAVVRGRMDPGVLRNALALAFLPRARACYVSRRAAKAGDVYLRGRLKLELDIERGELHDAVVRQSTLGKPDVEDCVRNAAWAVEYPRPEHRDAPTVANVNLVFSPRTERERQPDASAMDREIELILGPLTYPADFEDLLEPPGGK
jgi:hypothetical protein